MLVIWGWTTMRRMLGEGVFDCPVGHRSHFHRIQLRRWFTFFFIPVVPLGIVGDHVVCNTCGTAFDGNMLDRPPVASFDNSWVPYAIRSVIIAIMRAGGAQHPLARSEAARAIADGGLPGYEPHHLDIDVAAADQNDLAAALGALATHVDSATQFHLLCTVARLAAVDGPVTDAEARMIHYVGAGLHLPPDAVNDAFSNYESWLSTNREESPGASFGVRR